MYRSEAQNADTFKEYFTFTNEILKTAGISPPFEYGWR